MPKFFDPLFGRVSFEKAAKFIAICDLVSLYICNKVDPAQAKMYSLGPLRFVCLEPFCWCWICVRGTRRY